MSFKVEYTVSAIKELKKFDKYTQRMIFNWIDKNLEGCADPRVHGKALVANRKGQWRYRIGDYRLLCEIKDEELIILTIHIGHRREVYK